jgi:hypothetical protein
MAAVPDIESAFHLKLQTFQHPTENRTFYAPDSDPSVGADVPLLYVGGLQNYSRPHPTQLRHNADQANLRQKNVVGSGPDGWLASADFRAAYAPGIALQGSGQYVGLLEFDGYYANDPAAYASQTGITNVPQKIILLDGFNGEVPSGDNGNNEEVALDIEMAMAMAPALAGVVVFEAGPNGNLTDIMQVMSTNTAIRQFSSSWSDPSPTAAEQSAVTGYLQKMASQGQTFFCASGDSGAYSGGNLPAPIDNTYVTSVGGTTLLNAGPGGAWLGEVVWNPGEGPGAGSSGGVSSAYTIPPWQKTVKMTSNGGSTTYRNVPDVAMAADDIFIVGDDGQSTNVAGTSAASPLWAAYTALVNQQATNNNLPPVGFLNPALYRIGTNSTYTACLDDVTVGNNTNSNARQFFAVPGYDLCTGWGSPNGNSLLIALTRPDGFQITPGRGPVGNGPAGGPFTASAQTFVLTNNGSSAFNWSLGNTSAWLNVSSTRGTLNPGGTATSVTATINASANSLPSGVYTANLPFTNVTSGQTQMRQFTLQVGQNLVQDGSFEAGDFCYWTLAGSGISVYEYDYVDNGYYTYYSPESGYYFAAMGQNTTLAYLSQPLPTQPGQAYQLSFWLGNPAGELPNQFLAQWNTNANEANTLFNQTDMGSFDWSNMVFTVVATANVTTLRFGFRNDQDFFVLDNVSVTPLAAPAFQSIAVVNGAVQLTFSTVPGVQYQVQYTTSLSPPDWVALGSPITATSGSTTVSESLGTNPGQFYRIVGP